MIGLPIALSNVPAILNSRVEGGLADMFTSDKFYWNLRQKQRLHLRNEDWERISISGGDQCTGLKVQITVDSEEDPASTWIFKKISLRLIIKESGLGTHATSRHDLWLNSGSSAQGMGWLDWGEYGPRVPIYGYPNSHSFDPAAPRKRVHYVESLKHDDWDWFFPERSFPGRPEAFFGEVFNVLTMFGLYLLDGGSLENYSDTARKYMSSCFKEKLREFYAQTTDI